MVMWRVKSDGIFELKQYNTVSVYTCRNTPDQKGKHLSPPLSHTLSFSSNLSINYWQSKTD